MLGVDARAFRVAWTLLLVVALMVTLYEIRGALLIFVFAMLLAYVLSPVVSLVDRWAARHVGAPRTAALAAVYLALLAAAAAVIGWVGAMVAEEAASLARSLPKLLQEPGRLDVIPLPEWVKPYRERITEAILEQIKGHQQDIVPMLTKAGQGVLSFAGNIIYVILIPILSFFFLKDAHLIRRDLLSQFPEAAGRAVVDDVLADVHHLLVEYVRAMTLLSLATFAAFAIVLSLMGVPYSVLLSVLAGAVEFIPAAGPLVAGLAIVLVAAFAGYPHILWIVVFLILYRLFLDYVLQPYLMGQGVELPPLAIIFGVLAGEEIGGVLGMFLSVPVLAVLRILYVRYRKMRAQAVAV